MAQSVAIPSSLEPVDALFPAPPAPRARGRSRITTEEVLSYEVCPTRTREERSSKILISIFWSLPHAHAGGAPRREITQIV